MAMVRNILTYSKAVFLAMRFPLAEDDVSVPMSMPLPLFIYV